MKNRTTIPATIGLSAVTLLASTGCASSPVAQPAPASAAQPAPRRAHEETVALRVAVRDLATRDALAATELVLEPQRTVGFHTFERDEDANAALRVRVDPHGANAYTVSVEWDEVTPEGRRVRWEPTIAIAPGAEGVAQIAWAEGQGRRVELAIEPTAGAR